MFSKKNFIALIAGLLFGMGMVVSQMVDPAKVLAFLNVLGNWDPSLAFVMGGAIAVFAPIYHFHIKHRQQALSGETMCLPTNHQADKKLISGAAIFGIGWGMAGICPGPALTSIVSGQSSVFLFIACMVTGQLLVGALTEKRQILQKV